jgi:hypothetical protein
VASLGWNCSVSETWRYYLPQTKKVMCIVVIDID